MERVKQKAITIETVNAAKNRKIINLSFSLESGEFTLFAMRCNKNQVKKGNIRAPNQFGIPGRSLL